MPLPRRTPRRFRPLRCEPLEIRQLLAADFPQFVDPNPSPGNAFGATVLPLSTGNVVVTSPGDDIGGTDAGAVYLFNGATGALISTLRGSSANDVIGNTGVTALANGNYVIISRSWDNGAAANAGAVTWGSGITGVEGTISAANSLVGSTAADLVGDAVIALNNGNYVVRSVNWDNGAAADAGAVTWGSGTAGAQGTISAANSLVGGTTNDLIGNVIPLANGNYLVTSRVWDNGGATDAGSVTWGSGTTGVSGLVSAANSLVGSTVGDNVSGSGGSGVTLLANGNYVVRSPIWDNGAAADAGAVTWGSGTAGGQGIISDANSLVGSTAGDNVGGIDGSGVIVLTNGNYVVSSPVWDNGAAADAGAVTWGSGTAGVQGTISAANSLVGSSAGDNVGGSGLFGPTYVVAALTNGNYVVGSPNWDNGALIDAGAATWGSGTAGVKGTISAANSLVGSTADDQVGNYVTALTNGNYVVRSPHWANGAVPVAGAVTWGSGTAGVKGTISAANSLVGSTAFDQVGNSAVTPLTNGNYVVSSTRWKSGGIVDGGAVTWGSGTAGVKGVVSAANSLVGSTADDYVGEGGVTALSNGNYVVKSFYWDNGAAIDAGAATWGSGTSGVKGTISAANSLVGSTTEDFVGSVTPLPNGNYVSNNWFWDNGAAADAGAVTWGSGTAGVTGTISAANSLFGSTANDSIGKDGVIVLTNGNYVVRSPIWDNGAAADAGSVTWGSGTLGVTGVISAANSLVGSTTNDFEQGGVTALTNGSYVVRSPRWDNGSTVNVGAATWGSGTAGVTGTIGAANSLVGSTTFDQVGYSVTALTNGNYVVSSSSWRNGAAENAGVATWGSGATGITGLINSQNSALGTVANAGLQPIVADDVNGTFFARFVFEEGGIVRVGSQFNGFQPAPTIGLSGTATYTENMAGGLVLAPSASLSDPDSANFGGGNLRVRITANATSQDRLFIKSGTPGPGVISVSGSEVFLNTTKIGNITSNGQGSNPRTVALNANATIFATRALVRAISFYVASDSPSTALRKVEFVLTDGDGFSSNPATKFVNVVALNDAPVLDTSGNLPLPTVAEDTTNPAGALVSTLVAGAVIDPDAGALRGIAVTAASDFNGHWQFSTNGGTTWQAMAEPTSAAARLLAGWTRVRFIPNTNFNGTVKLFYRAWDQTQGTNGGTFNTSGKTGGTNSLSTAYESAALTVTPVNDAPVLDTSGNPTLPSVIRNASNPAGTTVSTLLTGAVTDPDAGASRGIAVTAASNFNGTWQFSTNGGTSWQGMNEPTSTSALLLAGWVRIRFIPKADFVGTVKLFYRAWDQTEGSNGGTLNTSGHISGSKSLSADQESASLTVMPA